MDKIKQKNQVKKESANTHYLDTLARLCQKSNSDAKKTLQKRAVSKYYTTELLFGLIDLKNEREDMYWDTFHCVERLMESEGKIKGKYCKNRWCIVCNRIRTGILINQYLPKIEEWRDPRFVTLTKPKVEQKYLSENYKLMCESYYKAWRRTYRKLGKTEALRKTETTWKPTHRTRNFHTHFHILINGKSHADMLVKEWLKEYPTADKGAQDNKVADKNSVLEVFKYMTKMWKTIKNENTAEEKRVLPYPPDKMDAIFQAFYGTRSVQTYGGLKAFKEDFDNDIATVNVEEFRSEIWHWEQDIKDWVSADGELLVENIK